MSSMAALVRENQRLKARLVAHGIVMRELVGCYEAALAEIHYNYGCDPKCETVYHAIRENPLVQQAQKESPPVCYVCGMAEK